MLQHRVHRAGRAFPRAAGLFFGALLAASLCAAPAASQQKESLKPKAQSGARSFPAPTSKVLRPKESLALGGLRVRLDSVASGLAYATVFVDGKRYSRYFLGANSYPAVIQYCDRASGQYKFFNLHYSPSGKGRAELFLIEVR